MFEGEGLMVMEDYFYWLFWDLVIWVVECVDVLLWCGIWLCNSIDVVLMSCVGYLIVCFVLINWYKLVVNYYLMFDIFENFCYEMVFYVVIVVEFVIRELV